MHDYFYKLKILLIVKLLVWLLIVSIKELMDYLEFLYSGKGNISRIYDVCKKFYRVEKGDKTLAAYFMDFKNTFEELNMLLPFSTDIKVQQTQRE